MNEVNDTLLTMNFCAGNFAAAFLLLLHLPDKMQSFVQLLRMQYFMQDFMRGA